MSYRSNDPCVVCGASPTDIDHIKTRGSGGEDEEFNRWSLCRTHHIEKHHGWTGFLQKYPQAKTALEAKGWEIQTLFGRKRLVRKDQ